MRECFKYVNICKNRRQQGIVLTKKFYDDLYKGGTAKELVKVLLEKSGYVVFPYGYESTLSDIKKKLRVKGTKNSKTVRRIKSSPDLLVYDEERKDIMLVEVKLRKAPSETRITIYPQKIIANYKEFWNDAILSIVIPVGNVFYAQKVSELETKANGIYNAKADFEKFEDVFTRVKSEYISQFRANALKIFEK